jgi:hypothetical protein
LRCLNEQIFNELITFQDQTINDNQQQQQQKPPKKSSKKEKKQKTSSNDVKMRKSYYNDSTYYHPRPTTPSKNDVLTTTTTTTTTTLTKTGTSRPQSASNPTQISPPTSNRNHNQKLITIQKTRPSLSSDQASVIVRQQRPLTNGHEDISCITNTYSTDSGCFFTNDNRKSQGKSSVYSDISFPTGSPPNINKNYQQSKQQADTIVIYNNHHTHSIVTSSSTGRQHKQNIFYTSSNSNNNNSQNQNKFIIQVNEDDGKTSSVGIEVPLRRLSMPPSHPPPPPPPPPPPQQHQKTIK